MKAKIIIEMDSAAFADAPAIELGRILVSMGERIRNFYDVQIICDINGNVVGRLTIERD